MIKSAFFKIFILLMVIGLLQPTDILAAPTIIDFNNLVHGEIVNTQFSGVTISAVNLGGGPDIAVAFDTALKHTRDPDLTGSPHDGYRGSRRNWAGGNLPLNTFLGKALIIQENKWGIKDSIADYPDDEGSRPAGLLTFKFENPIYSFGFDFIDIEPRETSNSYFAAFYDDSTGEKVGQKTFAELKNSRDNAIAFGDNHHHHLNRIAPILATELHAIRFDRVVIGLGGSGAIDNIIFDSSLPVEPVPEPVTILLLGFGLAGIAGFRQHRG